MCPNPMAMVLSSYLREDFSLEPTFLRCNVEEKEEGWSRWSLFLLVVNTLQRPTTCLLSVTVLVL